MKRCFVIMPIKQVGTEEYRHFRALFDNVISPAVGSFGYEVKRADDFQKSGSITKDIILPLAKADLVVADLTDLNANVFYELGVRHALRGSGTIMILDEKETRIPFDLTTYRVIKFQSDMAGIGLLTSELTTFVTQFEAGAIDSRDNLVHDLLPGLPVNVLATAQGSEEAQLRTKVQELRKQLQGYTDRFGLIQTDLQKEDPVNIVRQALEEAQAGNLPSILVEEAVKAEEGGRHQEFLETVARLLDVKTSLPTPKALMRLISSADRLGLTSVMEAILDHANSLYPRNKQTRLIQLQTFAHSDDPARRESAREEFGKDLGIRLDEGEVVLERSLSRADLGAFSVMLDAYLGDELYDQAFRLVEKLNEAYPNRAILLRNLGRALEKRGEATKSLEFFVAAANAPDADDTASVWLGNELHNRERHVDSAEAYSQACVRAPGDSANFAHLADELAWATVEEESGTSKHSRLLPEELSGKDVFTQAVQSAIACGQLKADTVERLRSACNRLETDLEELVAVLHSDPSLGTRKARVEFAHHVRSHLLSELTHPKTKAS